MAEITRQDLVSDDALQAPIILTKEFEKLLSTVDLVVASSKKYNDALAGNSGLKETQESTKKLTDEQRVLATVSKQIATETAKQSQVYQQQAAVLKDLKEQQKQRNALGDKEAINVRAANSSLKELEAALKANRAAWSALTNDQARNSETGKQLKQTIQEQYAEVTKLNKEQGIHKDTVGDYEGAMRRLKLELKAAKDEMAGIASTLGEDTKEFKDAAAKAGQLADQIGDIQQATKAVSGTAIENFAGSFGLLQDKLKGGDFKGAASAINGISASVKGLTFKEATSGLSSFGAALGGLGKALLTNPIFLIATAIAAAVIAFKYFESEAEKITTNMLTRSKREIDALTQRYDHEIKLMEIAGKQTLEKELEKQRAIIKTAEISIKSAGDIMKFDLLMTLASGKISYSANEEKINQLKEFYAAKKNAELEIELLEAKAVQDTKKKQDDIFKIVTDNQQKIRDRVAEIMKDASEADIDTSTVDPTELFLGEDIVAKTKSKLDELYSTISKERSAANSEEFKAKEEHDADILKTDLDYAENKKKLRQKEVDETLSTLEQIKGQYDQFSSAILSLANNLSAARIQDLDTQINKEKERANQEILLAGGNAAAKEQIQAQSNLRIAALEKKKKEEQRKAAQLEKDFAIVQAGILTAINVLKVFPNPVLMALAGTLGAIQLAAIIAKPLPQYYKGTDNHPGGYAMVGEQGKELIRLPGGGFRISPDRATVVDLPAGSEVIPNAETMRMLAMAGIGTPEKLDSPKDQRLLNEVRELKAITAKNRPSQSNLARNVATVYEWKEESETMKKRIRALSMGSWL
jgi:hypothetical protein